MKGTDFTTFTTFTTVVQTQECFFLCAPYKGGKKQTTKTACKRAQMSELTDKDCKTVTINMFFFKEIYIHYNVESHSSSKKKYQKIIIKKKKNYGHTG